MVRGYQGRSLALVYPWRWEGPSIDWGTASCRFFTVTSGFCLLVSAGVGSLVILDCCGGVLLALGRD